MVTEGTENTQRLEEALNEGLTSTEEQEVSEETQEAEEEGVSEEVSEGTTEEAKNTDKDIQARIDSEVDRRLNIHREMREKDVAFIDSLKKDLSEAKQKIRAKENNRGLAAVLAGDEENGVAPEVTKSREKAIREFIDRENVYLEKAAEVEDAAETYSSISERIPKNVVKAYGLDDPNPSVRAVNGIQFFNDTASMHQANQDFLMVIERVLPKGSEVRSQIEGFVKEMAEFSDEKSKGLYLDKNAAGLAPKPRKAPPSGEGKGSGKKTSFTEKEINDMSPDEYAANRENIQKAYAEGKIK